VPQPRSLAPLVLVLFCSYGRGDFSATTHRIHLAPVTNGDPYIFVPFTVPASTEEVVVELDYDRSDGANAIDFAIFDATNSGRRDDLSGYRGKNPNRTPLISRIGRSSASDGHIAGMMPEGLWRVMFYVYKTAPSGVDATLTISIAHASAPHANLPSIADDRRRWLAGDLHTHTLHSDGTWTVTSLGGAARAAGLDFLAVTDHNTTAHHRDIDRMPAGSPLLIRGIELTTAGGHMNVWGAPTGQIFEHRQLITELAGIRDLARTAHAAGAKISINHPAASCKACDWQFDKGADGFDSIEVWNGAWSAEDEAALEWWKSLLRAGRHIAAIGSSDSHGRQNPVGLPTTFVLSRLAAAEIFDGIEAGRVSVTRSSAMRLEMEARAVMGTSAVMNTNASGPVGIGQELHAISGSPVRVRVRWQGMPAGSQLTLWSEAGEIHRSMLPGDSGDTEIALTRTASLVRAEVRDGDNQMAAFTNPIWIVP
jgi:hypothetical protein